MSEVEQDEATEPTVTDVPEPDQEPHEPVPDEADEEAEPEAGETGDDEHDAQVGDDDQAPQAARGAGDDVEIERAFKALVKESERHANRIGAIMGEDANMLVPCPRCVTSDTQRPSTPGFIWPHEVVPLLPADKAAVKLSIGEGAEPEYKTNDDAFTCVKCDGMGKYKTGSRVNSQAFIQCDTCSGRGWVGQRSLGSQPVAQNGPVEPVMVGAGVEEPPPGADPWGRLPDDPNYGVLPGYTH